MNRNEFLRSYGNLVASMWEEPAILDRLKVNPHDVLESFGLYVPHSTQIDLMMQEAETLNEDNLPDNQYDLWIRGEETERFSLIVPLRPDDFDGMDNMPLREEVLELVAGGLEPDLPACCPCCCCESAG